MKGLVCLCEGFESLSEALRVSESLSEALRVFE